jgi:hypothetical protein
MLCYQLAAWWPRKGRSTSDHTDILIAMLVDEAQASYDTIATVFNMGRGVAKTRASRGRKRLREILAAWPIGLYIPDDALELARPHYGDPDVVLAEAPGDPRSVNPTSGGLFEWAEQSPGLTKMVEQVFALELQAALVERLGLDLRLITARERAAPRTAQPRRSGPRPRRCGSG